MTFVFAKELRGPAEALLISGPSSTSLSEVEYLLLTQDNQPPLAFEIRYECHYSPFREAVVAGNVLVVGHEAHCYLFDLDAGQPMLSLEMDGYFGHLYVADGLIYIADAAGLFCIDQTGRIRWHTANLGIDGVVVSWISAAEITGSGEWDPPGGWIDFRLDRHTGRAIN